MDRLEYLNKLSNSALALGAALVTYGFLSRLFPIDFFWEAKTIGWLLSLFGLLGILAQGVAKRKESGKSPFWNKIGIGAIGFVILVQVSLLVIMPNTEAYLAAKEYLQRSEQIKNEVGEIEGFGFTPTGGIAFYSDANGGTGNANIELIVKGEKAFKSVTVYLFKVYGKDWEVVGIE